MIDVHNFCKRYGDFTAVDMHRSGVALAGEVRGLQLVRTRGRVGVAVARNNDSVLFLQWRSPSFVRSSAPPSSSP